MMVVCCGASLSSITITIIIRNNGYCFEHRVPYEDMNNHGPMINNNIKIVVPLIFNTYYKMITVGSGWRR